MKNLRELRIFLVLLVCLPSARAADDSSGLRSAVLRMMDQARSHKPIEGLSEVQLKQGDPREILALLAPYEKDPTWEVRRLALLYAVRLAEVHPLPSVRQEVVRRLVESAISHSVSDELTWLKKFTASDFDERSKHVVRQALSEPEDRTGGDVSVWICGLANMQDQLSRLKELTIDEVQYQAEADKIGDKKWYLTTGWVARLARARMGVREEIAKCIQLAEREQDATERVLRILPQIGYIRQREAIEYLRRYLESSDRLPAVKPTASGEMYASRVMHIFAVSLEGYPVKQKAARNYTDQEIELCRKWMANKANWNIIR